MSRTPVRAARVAMLLAILLALPGAAGAGTRIPVNSTDDATSPTANRIAAVTEIVNATNARLARVIVAWPPNPCALVTEPTELCTAAEGVQVAYEALATSVRDACAAIPSDGLGGTVIADADAFASDMSQSGIANQLASIATVLGNADDRLGGIRFPPNPVEPELAAMRALGAVVAMGQGTLAGWGDPGGTEYPPNPCAT